MADDNDDAGLRARDLIGLGGMLVGGVVGGILLGLGADKIFNSQPVGLVIGVFLGMLLGCIAFFLRVRAALR